MSLGMIMEYGFVLRRNGSRIDDWSANLSVTYYLKEGDKKKKER